MSISLALLIASYGRVCRFCYHFANMNTHLTLLILLSVAGKMFAEDIYSEESNVQPIRHYQTVNGKSFYFSRIIQS